MMNAMATDRIEKTLVLRAPVARVWQVLTNPGEFGAWFGVDLAGATFAPGGRARGPIQIEGYRHVTFEVHVEEMIPQHRFSWRWHPYAIDPNMDYSSEPMTLVVFELEEVADGTRLTVTESGFNSLPVHRRADAMRMNDAGWAAQLGNIERHVRTIA
jgi:uncharacterized protein YndB with AHSA1/START domain